MNSICFIDNGQRSVKDYMHKHLYFVSKCGISWNTQLVNNLAHLYCMRTRVNCFPKKRYSRKVGYNGYAFLLHVISMGWSSVVGIIKKRVCFRVGLRLQIDMLLPQVTHKRNSSQCRHKVTRCMTFTVNTSE